MTTDDDDLRARAGEEWRSVLGTDPPDPADAFTEITLDHVFGRLWTRGGLSTRDRRLVTLTAIAMAAQSGALAYHVSGAYRSGDLTADDLQEWLVHLAHYGGWPTAAGAHGVVRTAIRTVDAERA